MKNAENWLKGLAACLIIAALTGCSGPTRTAWSAPFTFYDCGSGTTPGSMDIKVTDITSNSMKLNVIAHAPQPSSLSQSPFFYTWDTKPHDVSSRWSDPSGDPFFNDWSHWFIQNSESDSSLTVDNDLIQRAINAIGNSTSGNPNFELITGLKRTELQQIYSGNAVNSSMYGGSVTTDKNTLMQFYKNQMLKPGTKYYVYVFRYGDPNTYTTSYVYPTMDKSVSITTKS